MPERLDLRNQLDVKTPGEPDQRLELLAVPGVRVHQRGVVFVKQADVLVIRQVHVNAVDLVAAAEVDQAFRSSRRFSLARAGSTMIPRYARSGQSMISPQGRRRSSSINCSRVCMP